jgi:glycosyltransferase involved in cell wall biosynthesis
MGGGEHLWGKERVIALLMREQRAGGEIEPMLVTFSPCRLGTAVAADGFAAVALSQVHSHGVDRSLSGLARLFDRHPVDVIHSHGYRANIVARLLRLTGKMRGVRLVSTAHGWVETTPRLRLYNAVDRWTCMLSDVMTVPDARMLRRLPRAARRRHVPNAVPEIEDDAGATFERPGDFVAGTLGRVSEEKGIPDLLAAARDFPDPDVVFAIAGVGELTADVRSAGHNVHYAGYFARPDRYLAGLDVYVQASRSEGLSLALLEAMRAGKAIVATDVGATRDAVTDGESALVVPSRRPGALRDAVLTLRNDPALTARLGRNARLRFERDFRIGRQHRAFHQLYRSNEAAS